MARRREPYDIAETPSRRCSRRSGEVRAPADQQSPSAGLNAAQLRHPRRIEVDSRWIVGLSHKGPALRSRRRAVVENSECAGEDQCRSRQCEGGYSRNPSQFASHNATVVQRETERKGFLKMTLSL